MSYPHYTPPAAGHPPPTSTTYPYGTYHPGAYSQTPGAYSYPTPTYQSGITGYGWPYPYGYLPHPVHAAGTATQTPAAVTPQASTALAAPQMPQRTAIIPSYTPTYTRESAAATSGAATRTSKKPANFKGLFTKELKSLMYGFGDDRNPANDTVNVMEEILVEYITDVCQAAGSSSRKARLSIEDLRRALSRPADAKKLARMEELLFMQEDIKRARAQFLKPDAQNPIDYLPM